jgi:hypothetical protein
MGAPFIADRTKLHARDFVVQLALAVHRAGEDLDAGGALQLGHGSWRSSGPRWMQARRRAGEVRMGDRRRAMSLLNLCPRASER